MATIDGEHSEQIALLDAVLDSVGRRKSIEDSRKLLGQVSAHCRVHFMSEQLFMRLHAYPDYQGHVEAHDRLSESFDQAGRVLLEASTDPDRIVAAIETVRSQLLSHIRGQDDAFHAWLRKAGIGANG